MAAGCGRKGRAGAGLRRLTEAEAETLGAWVDALIPPDEDPGAREAGVVDFIDIQLAGRYRKHLAAYRSALEAINRLARGVAGRDFAALPAGEQTALVATLEAGAADRSVFADGGKAAFQMVLEHAMQGFYGSPRHGGNRDYASWKMIGTPPLPVRGRERYTAAATYPEKL